MLFSPVKPMLASTGNESFDDDGFIFEPKWDGGRILLHKQGSRLEAYTRSGYTVTDKFPELRAALSAIKAPAAIVDCDGVVVRDGRTVLDDFAYRGRLSDPKAIAAAAQTHPATFIAFDVLLTGRDHMNEPLADRKARLTELIVSADSLAATAYVQGQGKALHAWTIGQDMEGIVAKRLNSVYRPNAVSKDWIKVKNPKLIDAIILGYRTEPRFGLVVGLHFRTVKFKPVGLVEAGIGEQEKQAFLAVAKQLHRTAAAPSRAKPEAYPLAASDARTQWIEPQLCCRVQYLDRSERHELGATTFKGFLFDKSPEDCYWTY